MRSRAIVAAGVLAAIVTGVSGASASATTINNKQDVAQKPASTNVTVQPGDNLSKIASAYNTTYVRIYDANTNINDPDLIYSGQNIRIPAANEQLASRPLHEEAQTAPMTTPAPAAATKPVAAPAAKPVIKPLHHRTAVTKQAAPAVTKPVTKKAAPAPAAVSSNTSVWDRLAQCESSGNWAADTGNGFYGGLQFTMSSWAAVGGSGNPAHASREEQISRAQALQAAQGWGAWPVCSVKIGL